SSGRSRLGRAWSSLVHSACTSGSRVLRVRVSQPSRVSNSERTSAATLAAFLGCGMDTGQWEGSDMLWQQRDAIGTAQTIRDGVVSAREVVEQAIRRIDKYDPAINAVVHTRFEEALAEVECGLADGPLQGVPTLVKNLSTDVAGLPSTGGSRLFADVRAPRDSELVARYRRAGMVVLGSTNSPELGKNTSTEPLLHGPTRNPWARTHSPGGSSGGSAAAVAAGMVPVAHGNDGGGSIRIPAAMCGLFGLKP